MAVPSEPLKYEILYNNALYMYFFLIFFQMNNFKRSDSTKLWSYIWQI